jgi:hypothetical protein
VSTAAPAIEVIARLERNHRPHGAARVAACAALEVAAAGILLLGATLPSSLQILAAAASHGMAVLLLSGLAGARPSRKWLCVTAVLMMPCVGVVVAATVLTTRGRGSAAMERRRKPPPRRALTMAGVRRLGDALSPCDALACGDVEQQRAAVWALSRRRDPEAIALLRRATAGSDPDLALSAALALDEIAERAEGQVGRRTPAEVRHVAG